MFHDVLFSSTVPQYVLDAVSSQMASLKTNLCILLQDGSFFGFEGLNDAAGCCFMNCTHVWNYEQTLAFLFPRLERSMRETDFLHNTLPNGHMAFRSLLPLGEYWWKFKPCADGQMGAIVRAYRDWRLSGDTEWLRKLWSKITLALEFAWRGPGTPPPGFEWTRDQLRMPWDPDRDGVMEGEQHNTYDIEFYGPNTMTGSIYLAALKAAAIMAEALGEREKAVEYRAIFKSGSARYDSTLWNGHYYIQDMYVLKGLQVPPQLISPVTEECDSLCSCKQTKKEPTLTAKDTIPKYQYGEGCLSDQLLGQYLANVVGLGHVLNPGHVREAMRSIFTYNFRKSMENFANVQRVYALNDEARLLLCSWPNGDRPALPFVYSDEVWTGIEYQVAAELIYEGWTDEGLKIVKAVRDRYNGARRNPWDEEECGHHYARAMASWAVLLALSGFHYDGVTQTVTFAPTLHASPYQTFWSCGSGWGSYGQQTIGKRFAATVDVRYGTLNLQSLSLNRRITGTEKPAVTVGGAPRKARLEKEGDNCRVVFEAPVTLRRGEVLRVSF
jgi:hypothetical protein